MIPRPLPRGIHAATVCPMHPDFSIDEDALAAHVTDVTGRGIQALLINGHAGENAVLTRAETRRVIEVVRAAVGPGIYLTSGINRESSLQAAHLAADVQAAGADAVLVFPPNGWALFRDEGAAELHHRHILDACTLPLILYQAPVTAGRMPYPPPLLARLCEDPRIIGVKEGSWEVAAYEASRRAVHAVRPGVAIMGSGDEHLMTSWLIGSEASQVSLAAIAPEAVTALWNACAANDWPQARRLHDTLFPLAAAIYRTPPSGRATTRLKTLLHIQGHIPCPTARPPAIPLDDIERARLRSALQHLEAHGAP